MYRVVEVGSFSCPKPSKLVNEDFLLHPIYDKGSNLIFAVADGVGSSSKASEASTSVINAVFDFASQNSDFCIESALFYAKEKLDQGLKAIDANGSSATTLTVVHVTRSEIVIGHIGDCRAYLKKENKLFQLTKDHTRFQELLDSNEYSLKKLNKHKEELSSIITKALAYGVDIDFDIYRYPIEELPSEKSMIITLMSDGAYNHWHRRARFSQSTMNSPTAFTTSLRRRIEKGPTDDYTCLSVKLERQ
ncbi:protein phosphatase 2C domain-containing protein [Vibrio vulnificus]|uniref:protein phosphatase 2C domain-containing protein n=1 Tax=Vibrio vulnificus TaxID=672 RepID=UPI0021D9FA8A|nr:protein serine/threonine phosphatase 2C family protein [Vibrio vulnificus]MCU8429380.1 protein phosphatase 2C domain-containing protein [Vibrio vulnificus]